LENCSTIIVSAPPNQLALHFHDRQQDLLKDFHQIKYHTYQLRILMNIKKPNENHVSIIEIQDFNAWFALTTDIVRFGFTGNYSAIIGNHHRREELRKKLNAHTVQDEIRKLLALGKEIKQSDFQKGEKAIQLAKNLDTDLNKFIEKHIICDPTPEELHAFKRAFTRQLHSEDLTMSVHRDPWTKLKYNLALAVFSLGLSLVAMGLRKCVYGRFMFDYQTRRERTVAAIDHAAAKIPTPR